MSVSRFVYITGVLISLIFNTFTTLSTLFYQLIMPQDGASQATFGSGRYSKRKRTQVNYRMEEMDVDEIDYDSEQEAAKPKVRRLLPGQFSNTDIIVSEATQDCCIQISTEERNISIS